MITFRVGVSFLLITLSFYSVLKKDHKQKAEERREEFSTVMGRLESYH